MYRIIQSDEFDKKVGCFLKKNPEMRIRYKKTMALLEQNPYHPSLRLHKLSGRLEGLYSISINMQYRITIDFVIEGEEIIPVNIGAHEDVY